MFFIIIKLTLTIPRLHMCENWLLSKHAVLMSMNTCSAYVISVVVVRH